MNIAATHMPYLYSNGSGLWKQVHAFEYVDRHFGKLLELLPLPLQLIVMSDHGECFSEIPGCIGHAFAHPSVMEVPYFEILITQEMMREGI